jgi:hypothetical protein
MILSDPGTSTTYQVTIANGETVKIIGGRLETEGGALVIRQPRGGLEVAFGPGAWLEVQKA